MLLAQIFEFPQDSWKPLTLREVRDLLHVPLSSFTVILIMTNHILNDHCMLANDAGLKRLIALIFGAPVPGWHGTGVRKGLLKCQVILLFTEVSNKTLIEKSQSRTPHRVR